MEKTKEILKRVRKLEIKTRLAVENLMQGAYHSVFKGRGIEFSDVREYIPGDDVRTIDWNITARMDMPYVKEFIEERNLTIYLAFDVSASSMFGHEKKKVESAIELSASIMFAAMRNNDKVGLFLFTDHIEKYIPAKTGKKHILRCLRELVSFEPKKTSTHISSSISTIGKIIKKRSIIFIMSDFFSENTDLYQKQLSMLKTRHDVIAINVRDIREEEIPDVGYIELEDSETGEQIIVNTSDENFRKNYYELMKKKKSEMSQSFKRLNIDMISIKHGEDFILPLKRFFALRERRLIR